MEKPTTPKIFAVSLEGKFNSAYATRSEKNGFPNFKNNSSDNKMIVIADGDVGRNQTMKGQPLPLGADILTQQQYGNDNFEKLPRLAFRRQQSKTLETEILNPDC
jgi:hypothetical protein